MTDTQHNPLDALAPTPVTTEGPPAVAPEPTSTPTALNPVDTQPVLPPTPQPHPPTTTVVPPANTPVVKPNPTDQNVSPNPTPVIPQAQTPRVVEHELPAQPQINSKPSQVETPAVESAQPPAEASAPTQVAPSLDVEHMSQEEMEAKAKEIIDTTPTQTSEDNSPVQVKKSSSMKYMIGGALGALLIAIGGLVYGITSLPNDTETGIQAADNWCGASVGSLGGVCSPDGATDCGADGVATSCTGGRWEITGCCGDQPPTQPTSVPGNQYCAICNPGGDQCECNGGILTGMECLPAPSSCSEKGVTWQPSAGACVAGTICNGGPGGSAAGEVSFDRSGSCITATHVSGGPVTVDKACYICSGPDNDGCSKDSLDYIDRNCDGHATSVVINPGDVDRTVICAPETYACENYQIDVEAKNATGNTSAITGANEMQGDICQEAGPACEDMTGSITTLGDLSDLNQLLDFEVTLQGNNLTEARVCFHGDYLATGRNWTQDWLCLYDSNPVDGVFNSNEIDANDSLIPVTDGKVLLADIVTYLAALPGYEQVQTKGIRYSTGVISGTAPAEIRCDGGDPNCQLGAMCEGTLQAQALSCNNACDPNAAVDQCDSSLGLSCDPDSNRCRKAACSAEDDCVCPITEYACIDLTASNDQPTIGQEVTFTCDVAPGISAYYEFRYREAAEVVYTNMPAAGDGLSTATHTFTSPGEYVVQCRACQDAAGNTCTEFEDL